MLCFKSARVRAYGILKVHMVILSIWGEVFKHGKTMKQ